MSRFVLDAAVALSWVFEDEGGPREMAVLDSLRDHEALVPPVWHLEVSSALLAAEALGRCSPGEARQFMDLLQALPVIVEPADGRRTFDVTHRLARTHGLSAYDAAYLELATRYGAPVATLSPSLEAAAETEGVGKFHPQTAS